jgi:hypothetical protein
MVLLVHGATGGWDELLIALVAFAVMWIAVKLAGRKPAADDEDEEEEQDASATDDAAVELAEEERARPPATPRA